VGCRASAAREGFDELRRGEAVRWIVESIVRDLRSTLPVSVRINGFCDVTDVCLSIPAVIGRGGVRFTLSPDLSAGERDAFRRSAAVVRRTLEVMG